MKRFTTITEFIPLYLDAKENFKRVKTEDGKMKVFKTRAAVEKYCKTNGCFYVERKCTFYR